MLLRRIADAQVVDRTNRRSSRSGAGSGPDENHTDSLHSIISTPLLQGDYVYGVDSYGELRCLDAKTGDRIWESHKAVPRVRWATIHMVRNGDKIWMFNDRGEF